MANIQIAVINASTVLKDADVQAVVPALQTQVHRDFAPPWGIDADLTFVPSGSHSRKIASTIFHFITRIIVEEYASLYSHNANN